jgi:hypothetical protein
MNDTPKRRPFERTLVSPKVAADLVGVDESRVLALVLDGFVKAERVRGQVVVRLEDVEAAARPRGAKP